MKYFTLFFLLHFSILAGTPALGQSELGSILEECYSTKDYEFLILYGDEKLSNPNISIYDLTKIQLYQSRSYYKKSNFVKCYNLIKKSFISSQELDPLENIHAELMVEVAMTLGGYSFLAYEYDEGLIAADFAKIIIEKYLKYDPELLAKMLLRKIVLHRSKNQYKAAYNAVEEAKCLLPHMSENTAKDLEITILAEEAQIHSDNNQLLEAIEIYQFLLLKAAELKDINRLTVYNNNIGIAYFNMKDFGKSEFYLRKSLEFKRNRYSKYSPTLISNYSNLALVNIHMEKYDEADKYYQTLIEIVSDTYGANHPRNVQTYSNLGLSYFFQKNFTGALQHYKSALQIVFENSKNEKVEPLESAVIKFMIGKCYFELNQLSKAKAYIQEALKIKLNQNTKIDDSLIEMNTLLATIFKNEDNLEAYSNYLCRAYDHIKYSNSEPKNFENLEVPTSLFFILKLEIEHLLDQYKCVTDRETAGILENRIEIADSLSQYIKFRFDDFETRRMLISQLKWVYEARLNYYYISQMNGVSLDYQFVLNCFERSKNIFLYEKMIETDSNSINNYPRFQLAEKNRFRDSISHYKRLINDNSKSDLTIRYSQYLPHLNRAKDSLNMIFSEIKNSFPDYYNNIYKPVNNNIYSIQDQLAQNCYELNYFYGNDIYILLIEKNNVILSKINNSTLISSNIDNFLKTLTTKGSEICLKEYGNILFQSLIPPTLKNKGCKINIIPDGPITQLPFEVLTDDTGSFLFESKKISYKYSQTPHSPSTHMMENVLAIAPVFKTNKDTVSNHFVYSNVTRDELVHLPQSELEVKNVADIFNSKAFINEEATETNFKSLAPDMDIIHIATHGVLDNKNPNNSRLYFNKSNRSGEDGLLYPNEIAQMKLKADLVTLSACNTGVGKIHTGEGMESLGRAFAYAGCMNQLLSLWPANDNSTQQIMSHYYRFLKMGLGKAAALQNAKQQYLDESPVVLRHPYFWAGLVYYGNDTPLNIKNTKLINNVLLTFSLIILSSLLYFYPRKTKL